MYREFANYKYAAAQSQIAYLRQSGLEILSQNIFSWTNLHGIIDFLKFKWVKIIDYEAWVEIEICLGALFCTDPG